MPIKVLRDWSQKSKAKKAVLAELNKLRPGTFCSIPINGSELLDAAIREVIAESHGKFYAMSFGASATVGRTASFKAAMSAEALAHLEEKGLAFSSENVRDLPEIPDLSIPRHDPGTDPAAGGE